MLKTIRALQTSAKRTAAAASSFLLLQVCSVSAYANTGEHSIFSADEIKEGTAVVGDNLLIAEIRESAFNVEALNAFISASAVAI